MRQEGNLVGKLQHLLNVNFGDLYGLLALLNKWRKLAAEWFCFGCFVWEEWNA